MRYATILLVTAALITATPSSAERLPCLPCAGITVDNPSAFADIRGAAAAVGDDGLFFVRWYLELDETAAIDDLDTITDFGAIPWATFVFRTPGPVTQNLDAFGQEIATATKLAALLPAGCGAPRPDLERLYHFESTSATQPPVVFIHGFMGSKLRNTETGEVLEDAVILTIKEMDALSDADMKLIKSVKMGKYGIEVQLHDPMVARKLICEMQGFLAPVETHVTTVKSLDDFYGDA